MDTNPFEVRLELFDGPIDLLLHLVKKRELPIERVSLAEVTEQYLQCIENLSNIDFDIAGEYLVVAATLLSIKAAILLNDPVEVRDDDDDHIPDPHELLLLRLREASVYQESALKLSLRSMLGVDVFAPLPTTMNASSAVVFKDHSPMLLGKALKRLLEKNRTEAKTVVITVNNVSIADRMVQIVDLLKEKGEKVSFEDLVPIEGGIGGMVSSFLALLELCKRSLIQVQQESWCDGIFISLQDTDLPQETLSLASEFDAVAGEEEEVVLNG